MLIKKQSLALIKWLTKNLIIISQRKFLTNCSYLLLTKLTKYLSLDHSCRASERRHFEHMFCAVFELTSDGRTNAFCDGRRSTLGRWVWLYWSMCPLRRTQQRREEVGRQTRGEELASLVRLERDCHSSLHYCPTCINMVKVKAWHLNSATSGNCSCSDAVRHRQAVG